MLTAAFLKTARSGAAGFLPPERVTTPFLRVIHESSRSVNFALRLLGYHNFARLTSEIFHFAKQTKITR